MADITATDVSLNAGTTITWVAMDADTEEFDFTQADEKVILLVKNEGATEDLTVIVKAGDFWQDGAGDITATVEAQDEAAPETSEVAAFIFDSARVKDDDEEVVLEFKDEAGAGYGAGDGTIGNVYVAVLEL